ncbi:MAG TPA: DUF1156 domain-containing protein [Thermoleophilaceae bacterium]|nr:DUF1156 domain-containing protein [Thermoleophilaceae bacterium]
MDLAPERLLELAFPVSGVSEASVTEKSVRHGHISTLQQWFARRPLAVCRAAIFAALVDGPEALSLDAELRARLARAVGDDDGLAEQLQRFVVRLSQWETVRDAETIELARDLLRASGRADALVVDTYAGGGSVPLEALRLGLRSYASDLHPVATTALRLALGSLPGRHDLVERYRDVANVVAERLDDALGLHYGDAATPEPLAEFWARTCTCPSCDGEMPLVRTWWLARGSVVAEPVTDGRGAWRVEIVEVDDARDHASDGTASGRGATCIHCEHHLTTAELRAEGAAGRIGEAPYARLERVDGRRAYRTVDDRDLQRLRTLPDGTPDLLSDAPFDLNGIRHTWAVQYGLTKVSDLHNPRQLLALGSVAEAIAEARAELSPADADALTIALTLTLNRLIPYGTRCTWWQPNGEFPANMFSRQAIPMVWNYVEIPVTSRGAGGWRSATAWLTRVFEHCAELPHAATVETADAARTHLDAGSADLFVLDPPYFDAIAYSYLADPFYAWNRALLEPVASTDFERVTVDRSLEAIVDRGHALAPSPKDGTHFRRRLTEGFAEARRCLTDDGRLVLMYGHPRLEAWAALIDAVIDAGFCVVRSWPIHTERKTKFRHGRIGALSTSAVLACRPLAAVDRHVVTLEEFEAKLGSRLDACLGELEATDVLGSDIQAALAANAAPLISSQLVLDGDDEPVATDELLALIPSLRLASASA